MRLLFSLLPTRPQLDQSYLVFSFTWIIPHALTCTLTNSSLSLLQTRPQPLLILSFPSTHLAIFRLRALPSISIHLSRQVHVRWLSSYLDRLYSFLRQQIISVQLSCSSTLRRSYECRAALDHQQAILILPHTVRSEGYYTDQYGFVYGTRPEGRIRSL